MLGAVADHHPADAGIAQCTATFLEVSDDVIKHGLDKFGMRIDALAVDVALLQLDSGECLLQRELVIGGDFFADQAQGIAVSNGGVVVVLVDVVAKQGTRVVVIAQKRRTGETDFDGVAVRLAEVGQKTALRVVAAVHFVQKIDALDAEVVIFGANHIWIILKLLDVDHGDFRLATVVVQYLRRFDVASKGIATVNGVHHQSATGKFTLSLNEQIQPVDDEIELGDDAFALVVIGEEAGGVIGQRSFATALRVPDDALLDPRVEFSLDGFGGKELGIAHDVFVEAIAFIDVGQ